MASQGWLQKVQYDVPSIATADSRKIMPANQGAVARPAIAYNMGTHTRGSGHENHR